MHDTQNHNPYRVLFIMGVSGSGKSAVGQALSARTGIPFYDGDDFHPRVNVEKMRSGRPLDDNDRAGWLDAIRRFVLEKLPESNLIIACSALKESYRLQLMREMESLCDWVVLQGEYDMLYERLSSRQGHFMPPALLQSQLDTLELPEYGLHIEVNQPMEPIVDQIIDWIALSRELWRYGKKCF